MAAGAALLVYLIGTVLLFRAGNPSIVRFVLIALLASNLRALLLASRLPTDDFAIEPQTLADRFCTTFPSKIWPWAKYVFFVLSFVELVGLGLALWR